MIRGAGLWCALLVLAPTTAAQEPSLDTLLPIEGEPVRGRLLTISAEGGILLSTEAGAQQEAELSSLRRIELGRGHVTPLAREGFVQLRSGVRLPATVREATGRQVTVTTAYSDARLAFSLNHVHAIRFARLPETDDGGFTKYLETAKEDQDLIYFKAGDKVVQRSVNVLGFEEGRLLYEARGQTRSRALSDVYGIVMAEISGARPDALPRPRVVASLQGDVSLRGQLLALTAEHCRLMLDERVEIPIARRYVHRLDVQSDRLIYLTELTPTEVEQTPAFRERKRWFIDRSVMGEGIQLGGERPRTSAKGLVLVPRTRLTYEVEGAFDYFEATIGIDQRSSGPAHAIFRVLGDGKILFESQPLTRDSEPQDVRVPLAGTKRLSIEADFGKNFDFGDHCVFAEPRVIKQGS